jgi:UDP-glucose 4-epimerase
MRNDPERNDGSPTRPGGPGRRVLITGGAGFIGSHLTERLLGEGCRVCVVDNLSTGRAGNLPRAVDGLEVVESDLRAALAGPLAGRAFDEIYHLAAAVGVDLVMRDPVLAIEVNVEQTAALLRFAAGLPIDGSSHPSDAVGPGTPTFIASSSEVYGKPTRQVFSEDDDVVYGPTVVTRWSYAAPRRSTSTSRSRTTAGAPPVRRRAPVQHGRARGRSATTAWSCRGSCARR